MRDDVREKMVLGALRLLATNGLEGVSFSTVLELTGAPRGSIYHHFPEGKNQLIGLAIVRAGQYLLQAMELPAGMTAVVVAEHFLGKLIGLAIARAGQYLLQAMELPPGTTAVAVAEHFLGIWRRVLVDSALPGGLCGAGRNRRRQRPRTAEFRRGTCSSRGERGWRSNCCKVAFRPTRRRLLRRC